MTSDAWAAVERLKNEATWQLEQDPDDQMAKDILAVIRLAQDIPAAVRRGMLGMLEEAHRRAYGAPAASACACAACLLHRLVLAGEFDY